MCGCRLAGPRGDLTVLYWASPWQRPAETDAVCIRQPGYDLWSWASSQQMVGKIKSVTQTCTVELEKIMLWTCVWGGGWHTCRPVWTCVCLNPRLYWCGVPVCSAPLHSFRLFWDKQLSFEPETKPVPPEWGPNSWHSQQPTVSAVKYNLNTCLL